MRLAHEYALPAVGGSADLAGASAISDTSEEGIRSIQCSVYGQELDNLPLFDLSGKDSCRVVNCKNNRQSSRLRAIRRTKHFKILRKSTEIHGNPLYNCMASIFHFSKATQRAKKIAELPFMARNLCPEGTGGSALEADVLATSDFLHSPRNLTKPYLAPNIPNKMKQDLIKLDEILQQSCKMPQSKS